MKTAVLIAVMAVVTMFTRFFPFLVFRKETPSYISYLGKVLPPAVIGLLVIYCLKDISFFERPFGVPYLAAAFCVVAVQVWKRNTILSILAGTLIYMGMIRII